MDADLRQSEGWANYLKSQGWVVEEVGSKNSKLKTKIYIRKIPLLGSVIKIQRPDELPPFEEIDRVAKKHRALFVKLETLTANHYNAAIKNGFAPDTLPNLPTKTIIIDLTKSEQELWKDLSPDARQSVRKAQSNKLQVTSFKFGEKGFNQALEQFTKLLAETGRRQRFWTPSFIQLEAKAEAFGKDATLFLVYSRPQRPVAGALILIHDGTHSASSKEGQRLYASYFLHWEIIRYLRKNKKVNHHDLAGIYDPRFHKATKRWQGFTIFKEKFGGTEMEYPRPLIRYYNPVTRLLFKLTAALT
ncbi:MAG: peptidoglycan bridge formation glycyltransferase FemA/FemB family protein [candidate division WWE3 bacterium]|nr:peptidoglycan bridge formation glycyltransferase FemA/FemB family protein [candidate division WWE3 bacterium]